VGPRERRCRCSQAGSYHAATALPAWVRMRCDPLVECVGCHSRLLQHGWFALLVCSRVHHCPIVRHIVGGVRTEVIHLGLIQARGGHEVSVDQQLVVLHQSAHDLPQRPHWATPTFFGLVAAWHRHAVASPRNVYALQAAGCGRAGGSVVTSGPCSAQVLAPVIGFV